MEFNAKLQLLRKQKNMTQEELANALFVSRTAVSKWESGRGYPNLESLKAISKLFSVSVDELLSGEELISLAETANKANIKVLTDVVLGLLDCAAVLLFFLPFFGQQSAGRIEGVSLIALSVPGYIRVPYIVLVAMLSVFGSMLLSLQNVQSRGWTTCKRLISFVLSILLVLLFIATSQPYAATFLFFLLIIKGALLLKER